MYFCSKVGCTGHSSPSQRCADSTQSLSFTLFDLPRIYDTKKPKALYYCHQPGCVGHTKAGELCETKQVQPDLGISKSQH